MGAGAGYDRRGRIKSDPRVPSRKGAHEHENTERQSGMEDRGMPDAPRTGVDSAANRVLKLKNIYLLKLRPSNGSPDFSPDSSSFSAPWRQGPNARRYSESQIDSVPN
jgi:hypothetical protein